MVLTVEAIYENQQLRLLQPVDLTEGQKVEVVIQIDDDRALRQALGESARWPDRRDDSDAHLEAMAGEIAEVFGSESKSIVDDVREERDER
jgi:predicted DNA-binding antitoxin AbrB/MazE fold protein